MEKKKTKKVFRFVSTTDYKVLEQRYKKMAAQGWMLTSVKGMWDKFVESEPRNLDFSVTLFQPDLPIDYPDIEKRETYKEFCEDGGWHHVCHNDFYYVYCKEESEEAIPIHTEPEEEYDTILKAFLKGEAFLFLLILIQIGQFAMNTKMFDYKSFIRAGGLFNLINPIVAMIMLLSVLLPSVQFLIINRIRVRSGKQLIYPTVKQYNIKVGIQIGILMLYFAYLISSIAKMITDKSSAIIVLVVLSTIIFMFIIMGLYKLKVKRIKHSRETNIIILIVVFFVMWIVSNAFIVIVIGNMVGDDRTMTEYDLPSVEILTYEDLGYDCAFVPEGVEIFSDFLIPLSFEYFSTAECEGNEFIYVEYIESRYEWTSNMIKQLIINEQKEEFLELKKSGFEAIDPVNQIHQFENRVDEIYTLSERVNKVLLVKDKIIYIVTLGEPIKGEVLDKVINGLF